MLLSHNFNISEEVVPKLSREEFVETFQAGFASQTHISCGPIDHPHWIVEVVFPTDKSSPAQVGEAIARILAQKRQSQSSTLPQILILGGIKTTPAQSSSPTALQAGEWGVDVVETASAPAFLTQIGWEGAISSKSAESIFKIELNPSQKRQN